MIEFILQSWNPITNKYITLTKIKNEERAWIQYNKSYNKFHACRLIKVETNIIAKRPGDKYHYRKMKTWNKRK